MKTMETMMSVKKQRASEILASIFEIFGAATTAAATVRNHRRPEDRTLRTLGIDPANFPSVREF